MKKITLITSFVLAVNLYADPAADLQKSLTENLRKPLGILVVNPSKVAAVKVTATGNDLKADLSGVEYFKGFKPVALSFTLSPKGEDLYEIKDFTIPKALDSVDGKIKLAFKKSGLKGVWNNKTQSYRDYEWDYEGLSLTSDRLKLDLGSLNSKLASLQSKQEFSLGVKNIKITNLTPKVEVSLADLGFNSTVVTPEKLDLFLNFSSIIEAVAKISQNPDKIDHKLLQDVMAKVQNPVRYQDIKGNFYAHEAKAKFDEGTVSLADMSYGIDVSNAYKGDEAVSKGGFNFKSLDVQLKDLNLKIADILIDSQALNYNGEAAFNISQKTAKDGSILLGDYFALLPKSLPSKFVIKGFDLGLAGNKKIQLGQVSFGFEAKDLKSDQAKLTFTSAYDQLSLNGFEDDISSDFEKALVAPKFNFNIELSEVPLAKIFASLKDVAVNAYNPADPKAMQVIFEQVPGKVLPVLMQQAPKLSVKDTAMKAKDWTLSVHGQAEFKSLVPPTPLVNLLVKWDGLSKLISLAEVAAKGPEGRAKNFASGALEFLNKAKALGKADGSVYVYEVKVDGSKQELNGKSLTEAFK